jgi:hypothetical protein
MQRGILVFGVFGVGLGAGVVVSTMVNDRGAREAGVRLARAEARHAAEVEELGRGNRELVEINGQLGDRIADLEFMVGHAEARAREVDELPDYDFERFLRRNPEARKYFPYLTDAVERYDPIWPVDPMFALAILKQESNFGRHVVSRAGALGDAQFIASTGRRYGLDAREPYSWVAGRRRFSEAAAVRRDARILRDRFLANVEPDLEGPAHEVRARLKLAMERRVGDLHGYYERLARAEALQREGEEAFQEYQREIDMALDEARRIEREVRARQSREAELIRVTGIRSSKSREERDVEVQLIVNDFLAGVDARLSPMLLTHALVHHLADLHEEFHGDRRLVASRYNASRRSMEAAVASIGGGVGIPLLDETQDYVNRVVTYHAFFAMDGGVFNRVRGTQLAAR